MKTEIKQNNNIIKSNEYEFEEIYSANYQKVFNFIYRITGDKEISDDISQETFIQVFNNIKNFKGLSNITTWIFSIAKNISFRYLDKNKKTSFISLEKIIENVGNHDIDIHYEKFEKNYYINQIKNGCLLGLLKCLSLYQRIAFILNILNDLPVNEISIILDKSKNSTRILIHRARKNIRNFLCENCSIYNEKNKCKCENLINFSLKQNWIKKYNSKITPEIIESELKNIKDEILLYKTISNIDFDLKLNFEKIINNSQLKIFSNKKVK